MNGNPNQGHQYKENITDIVVSTLKEDGANLSDIHWVLRNARANFNFNLCDIRDENGENTLHLLAKYAPRALKKHAFTRDGLKLMNTPDNDGRYPLDYFFCFSSSEVLKKDMQKIASAIEKFKLKKPNWLEVKMLIVENQATYSAVDSVPMDMWQQETPEEFKACLKTERGQKFIKMAINHKYKTIKAPPMTKHGQGYKHYEDVVYYGIEINRYTNSNSEADEFSFFDAADTNDEIELSLLQLPLIIRRRQRVVYSEFKKLQDIFTALLEKTMKSTIDIAKLKGKILENGIHPHLDHDSSAFDSFMCENFSDWKDIETIIERKRLFLVVNKDNFKPNRKMLEQNCL